MAKKKAKKKAQKKSASKSASTRSNSARSNRSKSPRPPLQSRVDVSVSPLLQLISERIRVGLVAYGSFFIRLADLFGKEGI